VPLLDVLPLPPPLVLLPLDVLLLPPLLVLHQEVLLKCNNDI
jgi:hypothetical protein